MTEPAVNTPPATLGLLLAGGLARRMGGGDKPIRLIAGRPILERVIGRLAPPWDRLLLDARILRDFANGQLQPETFDQHLVQLGLARPPAGRSMAQRCAGAMRLWRWLLLATLCQLFWLLAMLAWLRPAA